MIIYNNMRTTFLEWLHKRDPHMATKIIRIVVPLGVIKKDDDEEEDDADEPVSDEPSPCGCAHKKKVLLRDKADNDDEEKPMHPLEKIAKLMAFLRK